ncbi:MAG TPA: SOS mutagenesis and repair protein UmuC, partial [Flavobacterium sp.]
MYALVDCNNFYASCERLFRPELQGKPIVVLSNNDGCIISRSDEAKVLGVPMGAPEFKVRDMLKQHNIHVFSSNYPLYGDLSDRV